MNHVHCEEERKNIRSRAESGEATAGCSSPLLFQLLIGAALSSSARMSEISGRMRWWWWEMVPLNSLEIIVNFVFASIFIPSLQRSQFYSLILGS